MTRPSFHWQQHWPTTIFVFALLPCLLSLGSWQLRRADEKRIVQQQFESLHTAPPIDATQLQDATPAYTRVQVTGTLDNAHSFLLDNSVSRGRVGFEVVTPFLPAGAARVLLVNRGWILGDPTRRTRPAIPPLSGTITLHGYVHRETENHFIGANAVDSSWPRVIEQIDVAGMQTTLQRTAFPYLLRLDADSPAALSAEWPIITSSPERHTGYAVQWFALSATLVLLWFWRSSNVLEWLGRRESP
jgi:cytochrome oxidase assembly protein ShyY1